MSENIFKATPESMEIIRKVRRKRAGIPARYLEARVDGNVKPEGLAGAHRLIIAYLDKFEDVAMKKGTSVVMCGKVGTGKTHLACALAGELAERGHDVRYQKLVSLLTDVRSTYNRDADRTRKDVVQDYISPDLLVLDEIGVQNCTADEAGIIYEILDGRYDQARPVVVIGNLVMAEMIRMIGERCISRLKDNGGIQVVFNWEDLRG